MEWSEKTLNDLIRSLKPVKVTAALIQRILSLLDYTSLNDDDTESSIAEFCERAKTPYGNVAAVCVYPKFVRIAAAEFENSPIKVDTVANFPRGSGSLESVLVEIGRLLQDGAQEIDVVFPYSRYLSHDKVYGQTFVEACKAACGEKVKLKVIIETGAFTDMSSIFDASYDVLSAGADFIKTSTGKIPKGATLEAAATIMLVILEVQGKLKRPLGIKVSGGIKDLQQAAYYIELADEMMGKNWVKPETFRIGSSKLMDELIKEMK